MGFPSNLLSKVPRHGKPATPLETQLTARDLQAFLAFSQHPAWVFYAGKPIERVVYYLNIFANCPFFFAFFSLRANCFYKKTGTTHTLNILSYKYQNYILPSFVRMSVLFHFNLENGKNTDNLVSSDIKMKYLPGRFTDSPFSTFNN